MNRVPHRSETGSHRIRAAFDRAHSQGRRALIAFVTAGYPAPGRTVEVVRSLEAGGADLVELGLPFSDPIADGPTIQSTSQRALQAGVSTSRVLDIARSIRTKSQIPLVLMTYLNPLLAYGEGRFFADAAAAGVDGLLVSDLPPGERPSFWDGARAAGLDRIVLVAPTTPPERLSRILPYASGFIYCLTRTGVTGKGGAFAANLKVQIEGVRQQVDLPVAAGFGVRSPEDVASLPPELDGVVIGARLLEILMEADRFERGCREVTTFLQGLRSALRRAAG